MSQPPGMPPPGGYPPPGGQAGGYPPAPQYPPAQSYRLRKRSTILIVGLVLLGVAAIGLLATVLLAGDAGPAAGQETPLPTGTLQPTPVATAPPPAPAPPGTSPSPSPSPGPTSPAGPSPGGPAPPPGSTVTLGDNVVAIPVPQGWETRLLEDGSQVIMADGAGHAVWAGVFNADPATAAAEVIAENRDVLIGAENYAQLETGEIRTIPPSGAVVSAAVVEYTGLITDNQATFDVGGLLLVAVRQDGFVLAMTPEISPAQDVGSEAFAEEFNDVFGGVIGGALASFSGTG